jgi:hypothetical protein
MKYFQRRTLMSRHVPLQYRNGDGRLPIATVMVGPSRHKEASRISVGDLMRTCGYAENEVEIVGSTIPYHMT